jgi:hypothetical protein
MKMTPMSGLLDAARCLSHTRGHAGRVRVQVQAAVQPGVFSRQPADNPMPCRTTTSPLPRAALKMTPCRRFRHAAHRLPLPQDAPTVSNRGCTGVISTAVNDAEHMVLRQPVTISASLTTTAWHNLYFTYNIRCVGAVCVQPGGLSTPTNHAQRRPWRGRCRHASPEPSSLPRPMTKATV